MTKNNLAGRAFVLGVFGIIFAGALIASDLIFSARQKQVSSEPIPVAPAPEISPPASPVFSLPPAPAAVPIPEQPAEQKAPIAPQAAEEKPQPPDLTDLYSSGQSIMEAEVDSAQVQHLLREHVNRNHPSLKLSDREYERLAETMRIFREANLKMQSLERTSANSPAIRQSLQEMATAMQDFQQITGMTQGDFFLGDDAPVQFGGSEGSGDAEVVVDFLSDHKP